MRAPTWAVGALWWFAVATAAQEAQDPFDRVPLRVTAVRATGDLIIDRGGRDGVAAGDSVLLLPPDGSTLRAVVTQVARSSAVVELQQPVPAPEPGVRGEVLVARSRRPQAADEPSARPAETRPDPTRPAPRWTNPDTDWTRGDPLLSKAKAVAPSERSSLLTGRTFMTGNFARTAGDNRSDSLGRVGADGVWDNAFGMGGTVRFDGEVNWKTAINDTDGFDPLVRRLSYSIGGNRYEPNRLELGRFLHSDMPEFGILDGVEVTRRAADGDRYGFSVGFLPELDNDFETGTDLAFSGHYLFTVGDREELVFGGGFQKTFHDGRRDRDLLIGKVRYLPSEGWDLFATLWIDFYLDGRDVAKDRDVEVTQAWVSTGRRFADGTRLDLSYRRLTFPDILREGQFLPMLAQEIGDKFYDRLAAQVRTPLGDRQQVRGELAVWNDEDEAGLAGEVGSDWTAWLAESDRVQLAVFGNLGEFSTVVGLRTGYGQLTDLGRWDTVYELLHSRFDGFAGDRDDLFQHRIAGSFGFDTADGLAVSIDAGLLIWDDELNWNLGCYLQKAF